MIIKNPMDSSNPANPSKKNDVENKIKSSFIDPCKIDKQYKVDQINSE